MLFFEHVSELLVVCYETLRIGIVVLICFKFLIAISYFNLYRKGIKDLRALSFRYCGNNIVDIFF